MMEREGFLGREAAGAAWQTHETKPLIIRGFFVVPYFLASSCNRKPQDLMVRMMVDWPAPPTAAHAHAFLAGVEWAHQY